MKNPVLEIHYRFRFDDQTIKEFLVRLDRETLNLVSEKKTRPPHWTALTYHQCANCPLKPAEHPHCPVALELSDLIEFFRDFTSYEEVQVAIKTEARIYSKRTSVQKAISSLMGIY